MGMKATFLSLAFHSRAPEKVKTLMKAHLFHNYSTCSVGICERKQAFVDLGHYDPVSLAPSLFP